MKMRAVLKSLLFSYLFTGGLLFLLALLLFWLDLGEGPVMAGIAATYVISCFAGGMLCGKILRKNKYFWGVITGLSYFLLLAAVSFAVKGKWDMDIQHTITTFCMCLGGGALGGMLS